MRPPLWIPRAQVTQYSLDSIWEKPTSYIADPLSSRKAAARTHNTHRHESARRRWGDARETYRLNFYPLPLAIRTNIITLGLFLKNDGVGYRFPRWKIALEHIRNGSLLDKTSGEIVCGIYLEDVRFFRVNLQENDVLWRFHYCSWFICLILLCIQHRYKQNETSPRTKTHIQNKVWWVTAGQSSVKLRYFRLYFRGLGYGENRYG